MVLPAAGQTLVNAPCLNPSWAGWYLITRLRRLTLLVGYLPRWITCPQTVEHPGNNHLILT